MGEKMNFLSLFSGIEAASVAWKDLGWTCVGVSEIEPFPCELLKQHYPNVPNLGDITKITKEMLDELGTIDIVVGGSPCQSYSVAGNKKGLNDPRGQLMLDYIRVVRTVKPKWFVWENVPGALSSNKGRDFGTLIGKMAELGYDLCWRVLDSKDFGVAQKRRRIFLVGHLGTKASPRKVLFEQEGSIRHLEESIQSREDNSREAEGGVGRSSFRKSKRAKSADDYETWVEEDQTNTLNVFDSSDVRTTQIVVEREYYEHHPNDSRTRGPLDVANTVAARYGTGGGNTPIVVETVLDKARTLAARDGKDGGAGEEGMYVMERSDKLKVRRLTPLECERLMGFPDGYTNIEWKRWGKVVDTPASHRYKALGNSMVVNVLKWIGLGMT